MSLVKEAGKQGQGRSVYEDPIFGLERNFVAAKFLKDRPRLELEGHWKKELRETWSDI